MRKLTTKVYCKGIKMKIVNADNFEGDSANETFVNLPSLDNELAMKLCDRINEAWSGDYALRYWKIVGDDYVLSPGFEP